jgi:hypothetical protein
VAKATSATIWLRAGMLLAPAYLWLTVAVFLPLSAMLFFSFLSAAPFTNADWHVTGLNYAEFLARSIYPGPPWPVPAAGSHRHGLLRTDRLSLRLCSGAPGEGPVARGAVPAHHPAVLEQQPGAHLLLGHRAARQWHHRPHPGAVCPSSR